MNKGVFFFLLMCTVYLKSLGILIINVGGHNRSNRVLVIFSSFVKFLLLPLILVSTKYNKIYNVFM